MIQTIKKLKVDEQGTLTGEHYLKEEQLKKIPLLKGVDRKTAKRSCDIMQKEYDDECRPVRVYLHIGNDPVPTYAGLAGACN